MFRKIRKDADDLADEHERKAPRQGAQRRAQSPFLFALEFLQPSVSIDVQHLVEFLFESLLNFFYRQIHDDPCFFALGHLLRDVLEVLLHLSVELSVRQRQFPHTVRARLRRVEGRIDFPGGVVF